MWVLWACAQVKSENEFSVRVSVSRETDKYMLDRGFLSRPERLFLQVKLSKMSLLIGIQASIYGPLGERVNLPLHRIAP